MKEILITGGAGFIGSALAKKLLVMNYKVIIIDNLSTGKEINIPNHKNCKFYVSDVNQEKKMKYIFKKYNLSYVFHFAACVGVNRTLENPLKVLEDIEGFKNIFKLCMLSKINRIFFSSSSEVYGEPVKMPQHEESTPLNSRLPYAVVKNIGESFCKSFNYQYKLNFTIFRFFNTYGLNQSENFVINLFIQKALKNNNIHIYGNGKQSRTFCYIDDNIEAIISCFENKLFVNQTVNIGNNKITTVLDLAKKIINITKSKSKIVFLEPLKEGDMKRRQPDISKMKKLLKRKFISLDEGQYSILNLKKYGRN